MPLALSLIDRLKRLVLSDASRDGLKAPPGFVILTRADGTILTRPDGTILIRAA